MSLYYPPLSSPELFFAYPDEESLRTFFDQTLGEQLDPRKENSGMSGLGIGLLAHLSEISLLDLRRFKDMFCVVGMASNVAAIACWLAMKEFYEVKFEVQEIAHPYPDRMYKNRPLTLALTNDLRVNPEGEIDGLMDPESIGLIDCGRRAINQARRDGMITKPISSVDDNLMILAERQRSNLTINLLGG